MAEIEFVPNAGQYRDVRTKKFVPRSKVLTTVDAEIAKFKTSLQGIASLFTSGKIDLEQFQIRFSDRIKERGIQAAMVGAGGKKMLSQQILVPLEQRLRNRNGHLRNFAKDIQSGKLSPERIISRAGSYSEVYRAAFFDSEKRVRSQTGFNFAKRSLDPTSKHCIECLQYTTEGKFVPIDQVIPPGTLCTCHGRCRCFITYKQVINPPLAARIARSV